jgi:hypothetical protein
MTSPPIAASTNATEVHRHAIITHPQSDRHLIRSCARLRTRKSLPPIESHTTNIVNAAQDRNEETHFYLTR